MSDPAVARAYWKPSRGNLLATRQGDRRRVNRPSQNDRTPNERALQPTDTNFAASQFSGARVRLLRRTQQKAKDRQ